MKLSRPTKPTGSYGWLPTDIIRDSTLTLDAKGLLLWLMSHAPGFEFDRDDMIAMGPDGKHVIVQALAELRKHGYVESVQSRDGWALRVVLDAVEGQTDVEDSGPLSGRLSGPQSNSTPDALPDIEAEALPEDRADTLPEDRAVLYIEKTTIEKTRTPISPRALIEESFEYAYSHWPKKVERKVSFERYAQVVRTGKLDLIHLQEAVIKFGMAYAATTETKFVPALAVWLNRERWTDELPRLGPRRLTNAERNAALVMDLERTEQLGIEA